MGPEVSGLFNFTRLLEQRCVTKAPGSLQSGAPAIIRLWRKQSQVCARLLDPFAPLNSILSLFLNHSLPSLHIKDFVYLLNQQKPWRLTVPWWGTCRPSAFPHGSSALQHHICLASQEHREPKERPQRFSEGNGVLSGRCAFRIRQTGRGT